MERYLVVMANEDNPQDFSVEESFDTLRSAVAYAKKIAASSADGSLFGIEIERVEDDGDVNHLASVPR